MVAPAHLAIAAILLASTLSVSEPTPYTPDDTLAAIEQYTEEFGVSYRWVYRVVACETGYTFDPYSYGRQGELGAVQLHPRGELINFYRQGYTDPYSPYQAVRYLVSQFSIGRSYPWSCK